MSKSLLDDSFRLHWTLNNTDSTISIAIEAKTSGWIGWGVSNVDPAQMTGSEAVIAMAGGSTSIHSYRLSGKDTSLFAPIDSLIPLKNTTVCEYTSGGDTWTVAIFTRSMSSGSNSISLTGSTPMIVAFGSSDQLSEHADGNKLAMGLNLLTGEVIEVPRGGGKGSTLEIVHGALMFAGFGACLPIGVIIARYAKDSFGEKWFIIHLSVQLFGYCLGFAAFVIALYMVNGNHFATKAHAQLGLSVIVAAVFQLALGFIRPAHVEKGVPKPTIRFLWECAHKWLGRTINIVSVVTIFFGFVEYSTPIGLYIAYGVFVGVVIILAIGLEIYKRVTKKPTQSLASKNDNDEDL
jgi:hypothetical protein